MGSLTDPRFRVETLSRTTNPQILCWLGMHQDYFEGSVIDSVPPTETRAGEIVVKRLLAGERGHYGPLEHPSITLATAGLPHSVMQQARTHRVGISFDVQSMRYTGERVCHVATGVLDVEDVFYLRPVGEYRDRQGKRYAYTQAQRESDLADCMIAARTYASRMAEGFAEEHARGMLPFDFRQNFVVTFSLRAALHFMDLRSKLDAQPEIQALCDLIWTQLEDWVPEIAAWYAHNRLHKARLAP